METERQQQLEIFLQEIRAGALKFAASRCGNVDDALDVLQDTMMDFVASSQNFPQEAWKNLFYKILLRRISDRYRKWQWRNRLAQMFNFSHYGEEDAVPEAVDHGDSEQSCRAEELSQAFEQALQALPARQQEAYLLRQWQQLSVKETADIMDCSEGSVKTHLSRAISSLKQSLGDWVEETEYE